MLRTSFRMYNFLKINDTETDVSYPYSMHVQYDDKLGPILGLSNCTYRTFEVQHTIPG